MGNGGEVNGFCSKNRPHDPSCEYYMADGGDIPDDQVQVDSAPLSEISADNSEIPDDQVRADSEEIPDDQVTSDTESTEEQIKAGAEGAAQGVLGPLAPIIETRYMGVKPEDITRRAQTFPFTHGASEAAGLAGSMASGVGLGAGVSTAAKLIPEVAALGTVGTAMLRGFLETASFAGSDEITKALLNQPGSDPSHPVGAALLNIGAAGLMGGATAGVFNVLGQGLEKGLAKINSDKVIAKTEQYLAKVGASGDLLGSPGLNRKINTAITGPVAAAAAAKTGTGFPGYEAFKKMMEPVAEKITGKPITKVNQYIQDALFKSMIVDNRTVPYAIIYANQIGKGMQNAMNGIETLFKVGAPQIAEPATEKAKEQLREFVEDGQVDQQMQNQMQADQQAPPGMAKGGEVAMPHPTQDPMAKLFPEQNILLNSAKARIANYLNHVRPLGHKAKLPFDEEPPSTIGERVYDKALNLALSPLSILDRVNQGDLTPDDMKHFTALYPEVHRFLSEHLTKRVMQAQLDGERPTFKKRQAMSLFLGASLDGSLTPQAIMAAQGVYAQKQAQQAQAPMAKPKRGTATLSKSSQSYQTDSQARETRMQKQ